MILRFLDNIFHYPTVAFAVYCGALTLCSFTALVVQGIRVANGDENVANSTKINNTGLPSFGSGMWWRVIFGFESLDNPSENSAVVPFLCDLAVFLSSVSLTIVLTLGMTGKCAHNQYLHCTTHRHIGMAALPTRACGSKLPIPLVWFLYLPTLMLAATWDPTMLSAVNFAILLTAAVSLRCGGMRTRNALVTFLVILLVYNLLFEFAVFFFMGIPFLVATVPSLNASSTFGKHFLTCTGNGNWMANFTAHDHFPICYWVGFRTLPEVWFNGANVNDHLLPPSAKPFVALSLYSWIICRVGRNVLIILSSLMLRLYRENKYKKKTSDKDNEDNLNASTTDSLAAVRFNLNFLVDVAHSCLCLCVSNIQYTCGSMRVWFGILQKEV